MKKIICLFLTLTFIFSSNAQVKNVVQSVPSLGKKITADDREEGDCFGWSSGIWGDFAVVGAMSKKKKVTETLLKDAGVAYAYKKDAKGNWIQYQKLEDNIFKADNYFGCAVAINDRYIAVGANGDDDGKENDFKMRSGAVHLYMLKVDKYVHIQKLELKDKGKQDNFGYSVAMSEKFLAAGCPGRNYKGTSINEPSGAVYVYFAQQKGGWLPFQEITAPPGAGMWFGRTVSVSANNIIVGTANSGPVYVYELDKDGKWILKSTLKASDEKDLGYGGSIAVYVNRIIVGAEGDYDTFEGMERPKTDSVMEIMNEEPNGTFSKLAVPNNKQLRDSFGIKPEQFKAMAKPVESAEARKKRMAGAGAIYIYKKNDDGTFILEERLQPKGLAAEDHFGVSVSISDSILLVGAIGDKLVAKGLKNNFYAGAVYVFKLKEGKWTEVKKITSNKRTVMNKFGFSVAAWKTEAIVGSRFDATDAKEKSPKQNAGAAYIYDLK